MLHQGLQSVRAIREELKRLTSDAPLPANLVKAVEEQISPEYIRREKRSNLKTHLTIVTASAALITSFVPEPIDRFVTAPLLLVTVMLVVRLIKYSTPQAGIISQQNQFRVFEVLILLPSIASLAFALLLFAVWIRERSSEYSIGNLQVAAVVAAFSGVLFLAWILIRRKAKRTVPGYRLFPVGWLRT